MDLRQLRYFVQIAESGSLSRAAEMLRVAQPSLSLQLKSLEDELGTPLLIRHPRGVTPTELGITFRDHARRILQEVERAKEVVRSRALSPVGKVSVGLPTSACKGLCVPLMAEMKKRHPGIAIHIVEAMTGSLDEWIQMGRLDAALLYDHRAYEDVAWTELISEDLVLVAGRNSPHARRAEMKFADLQDLELVLPGPPNVLRNLLERIAARVEVPLHVTDCDSLPAIRQFVFSGSLLTIMPHFAFADEFERGEMQAIPIVNPAPSWRLSVVVSKRTVNARASEMVAGVMAEVIANLVQAGLWRAQLAESIRAAAAARLNGPG